MADIIVRTYNFVDGTTAYGSQVEAEIENIADSINNLNAGTATWERVYTQHATAVPLISDNLAGSQAIAQFKNNNSTKASIASTGALTLVPTSDQLVLGTTRTVTITAPTPASASRTVTIPDLSASYSVVGTEGTQTINGTKTFGGTVDVNGQLIGKGTATNDAAAAGDIGEYVTSAVAHTNFPASGAYGDLTSISLTAGDWDIVAGADCIRNSSTWQEIDIGISTTTGDASTGLTRGDTLFDGVWASSGTTPNTVSIAVPQMRVSISGTTTYYLKYLAVYSAATPQAAGRLSARRVR